MIDPKNAVRNTVVEAIHIKHHSPTDRFHPDRVFTGKGPEEVADVWIVHTTIRSGLLPPTHPASSFESEQAAREFAERYPVGGIIDYQSINDLDKDGVRQKQIRDMIDARKSPPIARIGDQNSPLAFNVLEKSGIYEGQGLSTFVIESIGKERVNILKKLFDENWKTAAALDYCMLNLPLSSAATTAALYQFNYYISGNDFSAGYLWRDLECIVYGVETTASEAMAMRQKAGKAGSKSSSEARQKRREAILAAMEAIAARNPDATKFGEEALAKLACEECSREGPSLWRQGKGQVMEYIGEISRGEAGKEARDRFHALFPAKTA